jgi:glycosyltransferase involved in cell wall biosynthesis
MLKNVPIVSVCMIAYNQEMYIEEAIKSIIGQQTSFSFEFVISNDASTDKTHQAILNATEDIPDYINLKYYNHKTNLGMIPNAIFSLKQCSGKYISFCEGDDYWIDSKKLENQVLFLEKNIEYNLVTGAVKRYYQSEGKFTEQKLQPDYTFTYKDMIVRNQCPTCATTFRNYIKDAEDFNLIADRGIDSQIWIRALGAKGKGRFFGRPVAVYRKHESGASAIMHGGTDTFKKKIAYMERKIDKAKFWNEYFGNNATDSVNIVKLKMIKRMVRLAINDKKYAYLPGFLFRYCSYILASIKK